MASTFVEVLRRLLADPALTTHNSVFDASLASYYTDRVNALTPDQVTWLGAPDASSTELPTGALAPNTTKSAIQLDTDGFVMRLSKFRDGLQSTPRKIRRRQPGDALFTTPADRVRYVLADPTDGVLLLDQNLEVVRTFPGLTTTLPITGATYAEAETAVIFTQSSTEFIAIACGTQHVVQIFNYATGALVTTIGVAGTPGLPTDLTPGLTDPVSVTFDADNDRLFIACRNGNVAPDTGNAGFVAEFDVATLATPVFVDYVLKGGGFYRLNNLQCRQPSDVFFVPTTGLVGAPPSRLWVANGLGDVAALQRATISDSWQPSLVLEAQGPNWTMGPDTLGNGTPPPDFAENAIDVFTDSDSETRLFVAASRTAQVEVFRVSSGDAQFPFGAHEATYGQRGIETTMPYNAVLRVHSTPLQPKLTFSVFAQATGVVADETILQGDTAASSVILVADAEAGRLQRLSLPVYEDANTVTFNGTTATVPVSVVGWFLPADAQFPSEFLTVEVRDPGNATVTPAIPATPWREVPKAGFSTPIVGPALSRYQFRVRATLPRTAAIQAYSLPALGVLLRQVW